MAIGHQVLLVSDAAQGRFAHQKDMEANGRAGETQSPPEGVEAKRRSGAAA
jgi:hypothetical protein